MAKSSSWQSILQHIIKTPGELQRLSMALGLAPMTLTRWAHGNTHPNRSHLVRLVQFISPQYRQELIEALEEDYPEMQVWLKEDTPEQIPSDFFAEVLSIRTTTTDALRFWRMSEMILNQILAQLDPNGLGMSITLVQCMPPSVTHGNKIRSLRERAGKGTPPWPSDLEHLSLFLGMESLAGFAVEMRHIVNVEDLSKQTFLPSYQTEFEVSAAVHPIMLAGRVAGCLSASSTQVGHFSPPRLALLAAFSDLASLILDREDFYPSNLLELKVMPPPELQRPIISAFRLRVSKALIETGYYRQRMSNFEVEQKVWQEIEDEFIALPIDTPDPRFM